MSGEKMRPLVLGVTPGGRLSLSTELEPRHVSAGTDLRSLSARRQVAESLAIIATSPDGVDSFSSAQLLTMLAQLIVTMTPNETIRAELRERLADFEADGRSKTLMHACIKAMTDVGF